MVILVECIFYEICTRLGGRFGDFFFFDLYSLRLRQGSEDCIWWIPSKRRKFEVRSFFSQVI
jgi:hypothetical protein